MLHATRLPSILTLAACLALAACGGGDDSPEQALSVAHDQPTMRITALATTNTLHVAITIPGYPHPVDVYRPAGATRAIVFLHPHGGRSAQVAYDLGLNRYMAAPTAKTVNWDWLSRNGIIAVFPQGQTKPGSALPTWNNYVMDSGQDDVAFLKALSSHVKAQYGATEVSLAGHSSGGTMTARIWCEATTSYKAFVSLAGPMASSTYPAGWNTTCTPQAAAPYHMVVGGKDTKLAQFAIGATSPTPEQIAAGLTDTVLTAEWRRHQDRSAAVCGAATTLADAVASPTGPAWSACSAQVRYTVVSNADHPIASLEQSAGVKMVDVIAGFVAASPGH